VAAPYQAVILAAGRGSRLSAATEQCPKALLPIGPRGLDDATETSFLRRQIELLLAAGVDQVVVVVGYLQERVAAALAQWAPWVQVVVNPAPDISASGSLDSFQHAARSPFGVLDGNRQTLLMDGDIVYHRTVLDLLLRAPEETSMLVCATATLDSEEVLVYGTPQRPRFLGKGLTPALAGGASCIGEATGIVKLAGRDHALAREAMSWMLGDPDAPEDHPRRLGFGPARQATEHEELSQWLMHLARMRCVVFGAELPFMEVDSADEYRTLRASFYPDLLRMESGSTR
jgi:choline kinase